MVIRGVVVPEHGKILSRNDAPANNVYHRRNAGTAAFQQISSGRGPIYYYLPKCYWAFTRYNRRTDLSVRLVCLTGRMKRLHVPIVGTTDRPDPGYIRLVCQTSRITDRPVGQTVAEPPTSVNQINVAC